MIEYTCKISNCHAVFPPPKYCTDNGVMIAWNGVEKWQKNKDVIPWNEVFDLDVHPKAPFGKDISQNVYDAQIANRKVKFDHLW